MHYYAPEMFEANFKLKGSTKADIWAAGLSLYEVATGTSAFSMNCTHKELVSNIQKANFSFESLNDRGFVAFIKKMLHSDPE